MIGKIDDTLKLYKITADYRKNNPNKPHYYVRAKTIKEAKERFKDLISWLDVYGVEVCTKDVADKITAEPTKHIII